MASDLLAHCRKATSDLAHENALRGKARAKCRACKGTGRTGEPFMDDYGCWRSAPECRACGGWGSVEVPCSPDVEAAAVEEEIKRLKTRLRELKKKGKARDGR